MTLAGAHSARAAVVAVRAAALAVVMVLAAITVPADAAPVAVDTTSAIRDVGAPALGGTPVQQAAEESAAWSGTVTITKLSGWDTQETSTSGGTTYRRRDHQLCRDVTELEIVGSAGTDNPNDVLTQYTVTRDCSRNKTDRSDGYSEFLNHRCDGPNSTDHFYRSTETASVSGVAPFRVALLFGEGVWRASLSPLDFGSLPKATTSIQWERRNIYRNFQPCQTETYNDSEYEEPPFAYDLIAATTDPFTPTDPDRITIVDRGYWVDDYPWPGYYEHEEVRFDLTRKPLRIEDAQIQRQQLTGGWEDAGPGLVDGTPGRVRVEVGAVGQAYGGARVQVVEEETGEVWFEKGGVDLASGEITTLEFPFDSSGMAFDAEGAPRTELRLKVKLLESGGSAPTEADSRVLSVPLMPKPVMLLHGLWSNASTWGAYPDFLSSVHPNWVAVPVTGMRTGTLSVADFTTDTNSVAENASVAAQQIFATRVRYDAWQVDVVAHSMGGLISRKYLQSMPNDPVGRPAVDHLVMLGTPNRGSPCAELVAAIQSQVAASPITSIVELLPSVVAGFNTLNNQTRGVKTSIYAGEALAPTCQDPAIGDSVVTVDSAFHTFGDRVKGDLLHTDMPGSRPLFDSFVKPRLVTGRDLEPRPPLTPDLIAPPAPDTAERAPRHTAAAETDAAGADDTAVIHASSRTLPATGAMQQLTFDVPAGDTLGVVVAADPTVTLTLLAPDGTQAWTQDYLDPLAAQPLRTTRISTPQAGRWTLQMQSNTRQQTPVLVTAWVAGSGIAIEPVADLDAATRTGDTTSVPITVTATRDGSPLTGQTVSATVSGHDVRSTLTLVDDGGHGDGAAGDGVYGGTLTGIPDGVYWLGAELSVDGVDRIGQTSFTLGTEPMPHTDPFPLATAVPPTWTDPPGRAGDTYTIPDVAGVEYRISGEVVPPGNHPVDPDDPTVLVVASAAEGHVITGKTHFLHTFADMVEFTSAPNPTIAGTAQVGRTLTARPGAWAPAPDTLAYQWLRDSEAIPNATAAAYRLTAADSGARISVRVTAGKAGVWPETRTSTATATVVPGRLTAPSPKITGRLKVGRTVKVAPGSWGPPPVTLRFQWLRSGRPIPRATRTAYRLTAADRGKKISVRVTGTKPGYTKVVKVSPPRGPVTR